MANLLSHLSAHLCLQNLLLSPRYHDQVQPVEHLWKRRWEQRKQPKWKLQEQVRPPQVNILLNLQLCKHSGQILSFLNGKHAGQQKLQIFVQLSAFVKVSLTWSFLLTVWQMFYNNRAEDQVEIKMPPAYADIFAGSGTAGPQHQLLSLPNVNTNHCSEAGKDTGSMGSPPAYYSNTPSPQEPSVQPPQVPHCKA